MYQAVIISDTHGGLANFDRVLQQTKGISEVLHLGDISDDVVKMRREYPLREFYVVKGNNEYSTLPENILLSRNGINIFMTHGHRLGVKRGLAILANEGVKKNADIILFGHTHVPYRGYENGILLFNPGSALLSFSGKQSYGILTIDKGEIRTQLYTINGELIWD